MQCISRCLVVLAALTVLFAGAAGCSDGEKQPQTVSDAAVDGSAGDSALDAESDGDPADAQQCPDVEPCDDGERQVGCRCVTNLDRRCITDADCRPEETCESFEEHKVCIYEPKPVQVCPGSPGCDQGGDDTFYAGAASRVVTPQGFETPTEAGIDDGNLLNFSIGSVTDEVWNDCGYDGLCPGDEGYSAPDEGEGDGQMQGMWLAGFSNGRPAQFCPDEKIGCDQPDCCVSKYAHDDLKVQVAVVRHNDVTVAFASVDTVGWFHTDLEEIRRRVAERAEVDLVIMAGTHNHEAPDTAGQWGPGSPTPQVSGRDDRFIEGIYAGATDAIVEAVESLEPAEVEATVLDVGVEGLAISDSRPPYIFNDDVPVVRFRSKASSETIATMLSLGQHAEVLWSSNPYITADYPHFVRKYITEGLEAPVDEAGEEQKPALEGLGGVTVFFAGSVGGLINPGQGGAKNYADQAPENDHSYEAADALGQRLASQVLAAVHDGELDQVDSPQVRFARKEFLTPIENTIFQVAAFVLGVLERDIYNATEIRGRQYAPNPPMLLTEAAVVQLGSVTLFTAPGEVFSETLTGGFPGKGQARTPVIGDVEERRVEASCDEQGLPSDAANATFPCIVKADQENPPDWSAAPDGPYVYEWMPGEHPFFIGLGMDFLGYFVPEYDYQTTAFFTEAPGSHYEETNGIGPKVIGDWKTALRESLDALE
jgi:hypothetical protein